MVTAEDFTKFGDNFYRFTYTLTGSEYSSVVYFSKPCPVELFEQNFTAIKDTLIWLESHVGCLKEQVKAKLPDTADANLFEACHIVSFSLSFDLEQSDTPAITIAYGETLYDIYILATFKDGQVEEVELNL